MKKDNQVWQFNSNVWHKSQTTLLKPKYSNRSFLTAQRRKAEERARNAQILGDPRLAGSPGEVYNMGIPNRKPQAKAPAAEEKKNKPVMTFRAGGMKASIWENKKSEEEGTYLSCSLVRSYMDKNNKWQETNTLRSHDIAKAQLVLSKAFEYMNLSVSETAEE